MTQPSASLFHPVSVYSLLLIIAFMAWIVCGILIADRKKLVSEIALPGLFIHMLPPGLLFSRLFYVIVNFSRFELSDPIGIIAVWRGGLSLWGAFFGMLIGLLTFSKKRKLRAFRLLDTIAPGAMLFVLIIRFAERFTGQGIGKEIHTVWLRIYPFVMSDSYGAARHAVYRYETAAALVAFIVSFKCLLKRPYLPFETTRVAFFTYSVCQILLESMRDDDCMRLEFVRVSQIISMLVSLGIIAYYFLRARRLVQKKPYWILAGVSALGLILTVYQEFAVDTGGNLELNYLFMLIGLLLLSAPAMRLRAIVNDARARAIAKRARRQAARK